MRICCCLLFVALAAALFAAPPAAWSKVPLAQWTVANTVDPCTEGIRPEGMPAVIPADHRMPLPAPEPPFGAWKEENGVLRATGLANCWSTMLLPGEQDNFTAVTRFTVHKSSGYARQLPGGCVRWGFHWGENLPGWDVGVVFGYQNPLNFYRVQLSAARNELALWDATGGFLQLVPCKVELGKPHDLTVRWFGAFCVVMLDGKKVFEYWDHTLPYKTGQVGLSVWKSDVSFEQFTVMKEAKNLMTLAPAHVPDFHLEPTDNIMTEHPGFHMTPRSGLILFDGREPISYFYKQELDKGGPMSYGSLIQEAVKLKPGYRAAYFNYIGPPGNDGDFPQLQGDLPGALKIAAQGKVFTINYQVLWKKALQTDYTVTVRFDEKRGVYRYEFKGVAKAIAPCSFNEFEFIDPYVFNNRTPGPEVQHTWNAMGHRWWVYQGKDGWERFPLIDPLGHENAQPTWAKSNDFLYPDLAACPAFEFSLDYPQPAGRFYSIGQCTWGYDYHHREVGARLNLQPGDTRPFSFTCTALPPKEAEALFGQAKLKADVAAEKSVLLPFNPAGDSFTVAETWQDPKHQLYWEGTGARDTTVGHGDANSLRIAGPGKANLNLRQFMIEAHAKRWWVRGWVKTAGATAPGFTLKVAYPGYAADTVTVGAGDQDWTYFSFVTDVFTVRDETKVIFDLPAGTAWLDDFAISALKDGETPKTTATPVRTKK